MVKCVTFGINGGFFEEKMHDFWVLSGIFVAKNV